jgi:hypothetical protein
MDQANKTRESKERVRDSELRREREQFELDRERERWRMEQEAFKKSQARDRGTLDEESLLCKKVAPDLISCQDRNGDISQYRLASAAQ